MHLQVLPALTWVQVVKQFLEQHDADQVPTNQTKLYTAARSNQELPIMQTHSNLLLHQSHCQASGANFEKARHKQ